ncbi:MAG TPA: hypothetical protein VMP03_01275, partial [Methylomirabilota bacterium]|nr:hypothetical protein [Methylomirabilota bacterium]
MRINLISLSVVAASTLGLSGTALDKARAYVMKNPEGAYAPLAMQLLVELESRRMLEGGASLALKRRVLLNDLVYRPTQPLKAQKVYDS